MIIRTILAAALIAAPVSALACPKAPDRAQEREDLLTALRTAPDAATGVAAANAIWAIWVAAPDAKSQDLLDRGMTKIREADYAGSERILDELITYCPLFAEGWNQRAYARFLAERYDESLVDIQQTLRLEPAHFGALSGQAMIYVRQGRAALAQLSLRRAVAVHPWLQERAFLTEENEKDI